MSQEELASSINISVNYLSKIERDKVVFSIDILQELSGYYKVSNDYLLCGEDQKFTWSD